ncbi:hypothetical protein F4V91_07990 [Neorhizobium galegae]|uniref:Uncharacterized protein n=1 Tax=Neorhizobium galegae TaxID=399 RepID=A0A6A1TQQ1_NEOGA|nr:hypothetical protein [Neorhizobium galegae]KAB1086375.1 hypothetical protein F4V91_07990 [Neorhizobium galegae]
MSTLPDFIAELVRAANEVEKLSLSERIRLIDRGITTIRRLRPPRTDKEARWMDDVDRLETRSIQAATSCDDDTRDRLIEIAAMMRDRHIVMDMGTEIQPSEEDT